MHRIGRGGDEIEFLVEAPSLLILRMHREGADAGNVNLKDCDPARQCQDQAHGASSPAANGEHFALWHLQYGYNHTFQGQ
jgi:hypothetical protein